MRSPAIRSVRSGGHRENMDMLRWIWAYLFDCVHSHTTWPHQNQLGHAYVCCLECGREMPYSLEYMQIVGADRKRYTWSSRFPATASLVIAGALLLLTPSYALAQAADSSAHQSQKACGDDSTAPTLVIGFVGGFVHKRRHPPLEVRLCPAGAGNILWPGNVKFSRTGKETWPAPRLSSG